MFGNVVCGVPGERFEEEIARAKAARGVTLDTELDAAALRGAHAPLPGPLRLPGRSARAAAARDRRGVRLLERRPRDRLPAHQRHPRRLGHRRQRAADGVRQPRRGLVLGRRVLARRGHRRARAQRRLPARRAGRGRRLRRPHAARPRRAAQLEARDPRPPAARSCARSSATTATCRTPSSRSRRGGCTCSRPATPSARPQAAVRFAADAVEEGLLTRAAGDRDDRRRAAGLAAAPDLRPGRGVRGRRPRRGRLAGRREGAHRLHRPRRRRGRRRGHARSSSCARSPRPTTSPASTPPRAS